MIARSPAAHIATPRIAPPVPAATGVSTMGAAVAAPWCAGGEAASSLSSPVPPESVLVPVAPAHSGLGTNPASPSPLPSVASVPLMEGLPVSVSVLQLLGDTGGVVPVPAAAGAALLRRRIIAEARRAARCARAHYRRSHAPASSTKVPTLSSASTTVTVHSMPVMASGACCSAAVALTFYCSSVVEMTAVSSVASRLAVSSLLNSGLAYGEKYVCRPIAARNHNDAPTHCR